MSRRFLGSSTLCSSHAYATYARTYTPGRGVWSHRISHSSRNLSLGNIVAGIESPGARPLQTRPCWSSCGGGGGCLRCGGTRLGSFGLPRCRCCRFLGHCRVAVCLLQTHVHLAANTHRVFVVGHRASSHHQQQAPVSLLTSFQ